MEIIDAVPSDLMDMTDIDKSVIGDGSRTVAIQRAVEEKRCLVCREKSEAAGFLIYQTDFFGECFISLIVIDPRKRRNGFAKALIRTFEARFPGRKIFSSTNHSNIPMQNLFDLMGYQKSGYLEHLDEGDPEQFYFKKLE